MRETWTMQEIATLKNLWGQGMVARKIAEKMNRPRNGIIGKARRLNLERRHPPEPTKDYKPKKIHLFDIVTGQCRAILGYPKHLICCGNPTKSEDSSWCEYHAHAYFTGKNKG